MRSVANLELPRHYVRLGHDEVPSIIGLAAHAAGVVIGAKFDASHWRDESSEQLVIPGTPARGFELRYEVERLGLRYLFDLESWRLPELQSHEDRDLGRTARTLIASAIDLPLTIKSASEAVTFDALLGAALESQVGAALTFAPYFTIRSLDDPWLTVNLRALRATMDLVPDGEVAAWIRVGRQLAVSGTAELLAYRYAAILSPRSSTVVLTVTDMGRMMRRVDVLAGYLRLVHAFADAGLSVIVDGVGEFSPVPIAMGAAGSIAGTRAYRTAPLRARHDGTPRNKAKLKYVVPERFQRLDLSDARRRTASGNLPRCPHDHCRALLCDGDNSDLRHHNAHLLADAAAKAQSLGPLGLARWLSRHALAEPTAWAQALVDASDLGELKAEA